MGEGRSQALPSPSSRSEPGGADLPGGLTALLHGDLVRLPLVLGHWEHTRAVAEEAAVPSRAAPPPRQLTVNFPRHQRVRRGVPEDLSDLREATGKHGRQPRFRSRSQASPWARARRPQGRSLLGNRPPPPPAS